MIFKGELLKPNQFRGKDLTRRTLLILLVYKTFNTF